MELFKILGKIAVDNTEANSAMDDSTKRGGKLASAFKAMGTAVTVGMAAAGTAVVGLVTKSTQLYANYEQLVGGVETLFGAGGQTLEEYAASVGKSVQDASAEYDKLMRAQNKVLENSKKAFKTAGLSQNAYMETVTSFSASLLQSLGGDTEKAAEVANRAIIDMSDNANKMGTSMEMIQNAYNGFAKQNYTMLDNLKLGYGGTKTEMERLIKDASKMTDIQKKLGITIDANSMSFGNIVNAISVMQESMGIAGTTSKEAASTISGSIGMMKGSWENLITGMADENANFDALVNDFVDSLVAVADNLAPRIGVALNGVGALVEKLAPVILQKLPGLIEQILPGIMASAADLLARLAVALPELASVLLEQLPIIIGSIRTTLENSFPQLKEPFAFVEGLFNGLWESAQIVWNDIGKPIFDAIKDAFGKTKEALQPLIDAFGEYVTSGGFAEDATAAVQTAVDFLIASYETVRDLITAVVDGFKAAVEWGKEHETITTMIAIAVGTLTAAIVAYNIAQGIKNAGGIAELAQLGLLQVQLWGLQAAELAVTAAKWLATTATTAFGAAMAFLTSPITLVVLAIGALIAIIVLCVKHWDDIKAAAAKALSWLIDNWNAAVTWFNEEIIQPISEFFANMFNGLVEGGAKAWQGVKDTFSKVASFFGDVFGKAWQKVKDVFSTGGKIFDGIKEGIVTVFKSVVNGIIKGINKVVALPLEGLNKILDKIHSVEVAGIKPFSWLTWRAPIPQLPMLAEGGVLKKGQTGYLEGDGDEAVVPLEKNTGWMRRVAENILTHMVDKVQPDVGTVSGYTERHSAVESGKAEFNALKETLDAVVERLDMYLPDVLDKMDRPIPAVIGVDQAADALVDPINYRLGRIAAMKGRGR